MPARADEPADGAAKSAPARIAQLTAENEHLKLLVPSHLKGSFISVAVVFEREAKVLQCGSHCAGHRYYHNIARAAVRRPHAGAL